jgi:hypothetical protein
MSKFAKFLVYTQHAYVWLGAVILFFFFIGYAFWYDHKESIQSSREWSDEFSRAGIDPRDMSHDEGVWYHQRRSTCVAYGDWADECPRHEAWCSGGKVFGDAASQVAEIKRALENGGTHPECPLIYAGAD